MLAAGVHDATAATGSPQVWQVSQISGVVPFFGPQPWNFGGVIFAGGPINQGAIFTNCEAVAGETYTVTWNTGLGPGSIDANPRHALTLEIFDGRGFGGPLLGVQTLSNYQRPAPNGVIVYTAPTSGVQTLRIRLSALGANSDTDIQVDFVTVTSSTGTVFDNQFDVTWDVDQDNDGTFELTDIPLYSSILNARFREHAIESPPIANAGIDFSVNEGQLAVALDGSGSSDPDNDPLTYAWVQVGGTTVALTGATTVSPTFTAPVVPLGGETLSFDLTVTANGESSTDTVSVTVVNVNHAPVADAGVDQTLANANAVAEGSPVTLHGEDSFDIDNDVIDFSWTQVSGPAVTLVGANTATPTFDAPYFESGGAPGVVATLVFELLVDDGFPADAPAENHTLANVRDTVTIEITNTNNLPVASAGADQTVDENTSATLNGSLSTDPDTDVLTYAWTQVGGASVVLSSATSASPSFIAPFVSAGGEDLEFQLSVDDGYGGSATDNVVIHVQNANDPPLAGAAQPTIGLLWPPTHGLVAVGITGVSDPDNNATIVITSVTQDEPTNGQGDGDTAIDAIIDGESVLVRAERSGKGDGRVYHIHFTASDLEGSASGVVKVTVPQSKKKAAVDGGELFNSTE